MESNLFCLCDLIVCAYFYSLPFKVAMRAVAVHRSKVNVLAPQRHRHIRLILARSVRVSCAPQQIVGDSFPLPVNSHGYQITAHLTNALSGSIMKVRRSSLRMPAHTYTYVRGVRIFDLDAQSRYPIAQLLPSE